jgi:RimJ/RimL family protein N-acetyltransferase
MQLAEVDIRINYFHDASDEHLRLLGVDRSLLPTRKAWAASYREDYARPIRDRVNYSLVWQQAGEIVGFSSTDRIDFGNEAFMHLHLVEAGLRSTGLGTQFVRLSADAYFEALELRRLFCEPNAFNIAPNRTLQRAGFRYLFSPTKPSPAPSIFPRSQLGGCWTAPELPDRAGPFRSWPTPQGSMFSRSSRRLGCVGFQPSVF